MAAHTQTIPNGRLRAMIIPREHGAWGMLLVPLATGAIVAVPSGVNAVALMLFTVAAMSLFWLGTPVEALLGTSAVKAQSAQERATVLRVVVVTALLAAISLTALFWKGSNSELLVIGAIAGLAFMVQAGVKRMGRRGRMPAQVIGAIGLTSTAAGAYYVATGRLDHVAAALWLANWFFAGNQIHFVQLRIRGSRAASFDEKMQQGLPFFAGQIALIGAVLAACRWGLVPSAVALAFVPVLVRGTLWFVSVRRPLNVHRLGFSELGLALAFGALLCAGFLL